MGKPWETYKQEIYRYYIEEGKPLAEVREILKAKYNFEACKRSYQNQIEVWGFKKNVRSADMRAYLEQKQQNIPDSEMGLSQDIIDKITPRKVRRYEKRYAGKSSPSREATSPREGRRPEEYENWESYDVDQHSLFDYPDSYPVTPSHGSEDHFYTGDMISKTFSVLVIQAILTTGVKQTTDSIDLMKAALAGRYDGLRRLLMGGETPNVLDRDGNTSLHYLVRGFHKLLDRAAHSPGLLSGDRAMGSSEEFEERIAGFNACLNLLLSYGAMATPNERGDTAAQMASARLAEYTKDPYNAAAGTHKQWTQFVNSMSAATSEYTR
ncbi:hypothetical protein TWF970_010358 [Orbilia oligospora]|uniref:Clr5 domain-containing protein n=1 Tax=Orbilia oligospora TaxID=2813651 RepID=A0A7C8RFV5_ORBOL|nr:hypothetical protein TWF970_010358 [Orbilia oligospora]